MSHLPTLLGGSAPISEPSAPHPRSRGPKIRVWFGEYHNSPKDSAVICDDLARFRGTDWLPKQVIKYHGQFEIGETGHIHLQFVVHLDNSYYAADVRRYLKMDPRHCWLERLKSLKGWDYPIKEDTRIEGPWMFDTSRKRPRDEEDLEAKIALMEEARSTSLTEFLSAHPAGASLTITHEKFWGVAQRCVEPYRGPVKIYWRWGEPGSGKTEWILRQWSEKEVLYTEMEGKKFMESSQCGAHVLVLDEADKEGTEVNWGWLLRMTNPGFTKTYPSKGGRSPWVFDTVVVMTNKYPALCIHDENILGGIILRIQRGGGTIIKCSRTEDARLHYSETETDAFAKPISESVEVTWSSV